MIKYLFLCILIILSSSAYDKTNSLQYAYFSAATHCSKNSIQSWSCKHCTIIPGLINVTYIENTLTQIVGFIGYHAPTNRIILSWRGTIDIRNWVQDFNFQKQSYVCKGCQIHVGFLDSYRSVEKNVKAKVQQLMSAYKTAKMFITGHSLGGALATVCALQLQLQYGKVQQVHNFGSPRVGNANLAKFIESKIPISYRVIHNKDIVPHLPPQMLVYHHQPFQVFYNQQMTDYKICDQSGQDKTCSDRFDPDYSFADHGKYWIDMDC